MPDRPADGHPSDLGLLWRQVRAQNKLFLRNPFSAFFSLAFPVMFLLLFGSLNGSGRIAELNNIRYIQFLAPGMLVLWMVVGVVVAVRFFRWEPKTGASGGRRRRSGRTAQVAEADPTA